MIKPFKNIIMTDEQNELVIDNFVLWGKAVLQ